MPHPAPNLGDLLTTAQATTLAKYANKSSITRRVAEGKLTPAVTLASGALLFHRADIERLAAERDGSAA